ncbi:adenosylcobinamide-GDP ribazoletransferase [Terrabacter terrigena]|uniref:Adenosylcobinamide-GDP ribazoletransferase n=1 Tax=Terrabacter terrigena TaxID=574718 RepID=A0ABW3MTP8_9MICO
MRDAWRLALGTFTALRVGPPRGVDGRVLGGAMLLAPLTAAPAAVGWVGLALLAAASVLPPAVAAGLALVVTALLSRGLHLDGLADLADGLTSGHDPVRSLEVMRRGDTGPAGAATLVLTLLVDAACLTTLFANGVGSSLAVTALVASRLACAVCARHGIPAARAEGLGQGVAGTVPRRALTALTGAAGVVAVGAGALVGRVGALSPYATGAAHAVVVAVALGVSVAVRRHAVRRLGGVTGDVIGAAIEISLAGALVAASVAVTRLA